MALFDFYRKFAELFPAQGAPPLLLTPVANSKNFTSRKVLNILFGLFPVVEFATTVDTSFFLQVNHWL
jgi:hypothetical protein